MVDNVAITAGTGTTIAADDVGGVLHQRVKTTWGPDGTANDADVASGKPLPVQLRGSDGSNLLAGKYETVAASQSTQTIGATGAAGDYLSHVVVSPVTTSPGVVTILDNATPVVSFAGGSSSLSNLMPFIIPVGIVSVSGAWKITTGADISCVAVGNFT